ncbi:SCO7613 C-terminal domain-containing membrane protein [Geodermatophilus sp. SYSU D00815]
MHPTPAFPCPVCGTPAAGPAGAPCPTCGLPAVGQAALVVARIGATLAELTRDRDALVATLRAAAPGAAPAPAPAPAPVAPPPRRVHAPLPPPPPSPPPGPPRRRLSPQQVLLGLGALLLVAGALAFVALAWTRLGLAFQATVMLVVTAATCGASAWTARRGLRATEETLAAAGTALLAVDLGAAYAKGLLGVDELPLRLWAAIGCGVVVAVAVGLGRATRTTAAWPLVALLAAQPAPFLLLPPGALDGPSGVAVAFAVALLDVAVLLRVRRPLVPVAAVLALLATAAGAVGAIVVAESSGPAEAWPATAVLAAAALGAVLLPRLPDAGGLLPSPVLVAGTGAAATGLALAGSLHGSGRPGAVVAAGVGLAALTTAVPLARVPVAAAGLAAGGAATAVLGAGHLAADGRWLPLALVVLAATAPAAVAAVLLPRLRVAAAGAAVAAPAGAVLVAVHGELLAPPTGGLLLALVAAAAFGLAALRAGAPEEAALAAPAGAAGLLAGAVSTTAGAWGQVGLQLAVVGAAAGCYALVARRGWIAVVAVADLVVATWVAVGGAGVTTPEAYTLPAAAGLLLVGLPRLLSRGPSWAAEGPAVAVGLAPSAFVVVTEPTALRLVLVVSVAAALAVGGALGHRQAPFVVGSAVLAFVVVGRLWPYAPLLPRWVTLTAAGLVLLLVGATYERRRQQAREAVAWVAQMR